MESPFDAQLERFISIESRGQKTPEISVIIGDAVITLSEMEQNHNRFLIPESTPIKSSKVTVIQMNHIKDGLSEIEEEREFKNFSDYLLERKKGAPVQKCPSRAKKNLLKDVSPVKSTDKVTVLNVKIISSGGNNLEIQNTNARTVFNAMKRLSKSFHSDQVKQPIMGTDMLKLEYGKKEDSEIIEELVNDRFGETLNEFSRRSFKRRSKRNFSKIETETSDFSKTDTCLAVSNETDDSPKAHAVKEINNDDKVVSKCNASESKDIAVQSHELITKCHSNYSIEAGYVSYEEQPSVTHNSNQDESSKSNESEYNRTKFLNDALGENMNLANTNTTNNTCAYQSVGTVDLSLLMSQAQGSDKISPSNSFDKGCSTDSGLEKEHEYAEINYYSNVNQSCEMKKLNDELNIQTQYIWQSSKLLNLCTNTKEFNSGNEQVEAERILLISTIKRDLLYKEIYKQYDTPKSGSNLGTVQISQIKFPSKQVCALLNSTRKRNVTEWFICVLCNELVVHATKSVTANNDGTVEFPEEFIFEFLPNDFQISLQLYCLEVKNNLRTFSHESKYHLNKESKSICSSTRKFFNNLLHTSEQKIPENSLRQSSYNIQGSCILTVDSLKCSGQLKLFNNAHSDLDGSVKLHINGNVTITEQASGFLNIGIERNGTTVWNQRWCVLHKFELTYFSYPCDEEPINTIDLRSSVNACVALAERELCPKANTLYIDCISNEAGLGRSSVVIKRYFLSTEKWDELKMWEKKLNNTLTVLKCWDQMNY